MGLPSVEGWPLAGASQLGEELLSGEELLLEPEWPSGQELGSASGREELSLHKSDRHQGFHTRYILSALRQEEFPYRRG